jgi:hypothetical protein
VSSRKASSKKHRSLADSERLAADVLGAMREAPTRLGSRGSAFDDGGYAEEQRQQAIMTKRDAALHSETLDTAMRTPCDRPSMRPPTSST